MRKVGRHAVATVFHQGGKQLCRSVCNEVKTFQFSTFHVMLFWIELNRAETVVATTTVVCALHIMP